MALLVAPSVVPEKAWASISKSPHIWNNEKKSYLVVFTDFADEVAKCLVHIDALLSRCLNESAPQMLCKVATLCDDYQSENNVVTSLAVVTGTTGEDKVDVYAVKVRTIHPNLALELKVTLIGNQDDRKAVLVLDS